MNRLDETSVVMNAESGRRGGVLSAPWAVASGIDDAILNLPDVTQGRVSKCRGVACRTHVRRCFHIDLTIKKKNDFFFFFFFLDFIREISIMNL